MNLLRCVLGLIPCGRLVPETPYELVIVLLFVAFSLLELAAMVSLVLLLAQAVLWGMRAWRRASKEERRCGSG